MWAYSINVMKQTCSMTWLATLLERVDLLKIRAILDQGGGGAMIFSFEVIKAFMLLLVKCYDNKMV